MTYTLDGSSEGFARLNALREDLIQSGKGKNDPFAFHRAYEEFLFPDAPEQRAEPETVNKLNRDSDKLLGGLCTLNEPEIAKLSKLSVVDRVKLLLPGKRYANFASTVYNQSPALLRAATELVLPKVETEVEERIGGPFSVVRVNRLVTKGGASDKSALWHFDPTPVNFFKIFAYLNGPESHDGTTDFLSGDASAALLEKGYHLDPIADRKEDVADLPCEASQVNQIRERGDVFLFNPAMTVHRGNYPSFGRRDVFEISILRSPVAWRESFDQLYELTQFSGSPSYATWPRWVSQ